MRHAGLGIGLSVCLLAAVSAAQPQPQPQPDETEPPSGDENGAKADAPPAPPGDEVTPQPPPADASPEEQKPPFDTSAAWGPSTANAALAPPYEIASTSSSSEPSSKVAVLVNPAGILLDAFTFDVGLALSEKVALVGIGTVFLGDYSGGGGGVGVQYFPAPRRAFHGFFMMPSLRYWSTSTEITVTELDQFGDPVNVKKDATASLIAVGCLFGYQFNWGFALRLGGGAYYAAATAESGGYEADFAGFVPALEVAVGAAF